MADQAGRELANFLQAVCSHPQFTGSSEGISVDGLEEVLRSIFLTMQVQDAVSQASLATSMLDYKVLQSWSSYCHSENMLGTATLAQLLAFLKATYDSISLAYQALEELVALSFNASKDLPVFNQKFDFLLSCANFPAGQAALALNHYHRAMPVDIKKELFAADINNVSQAKNCVLDFWHKCQSL